MAYVLSVVLATAVGVLPGLYLGGALGWLASMVRRKRAGVESADADHLTFTEAMLWGCGMALGVGATVASLFWMVDVSWRALAWPVTAGALVAGASWARVARIGMPGMRGGSLLLACAGLSALVAGLAAAATR